MKCWKDRLEGEASGLSLYYVPTNQRACRLNINLGTGRLKKGSEDRLGNDKVLAKKQQELKAFRGDPSGLALPVSFALSLPPLSLTHGQA